MVDVGFFNILFDKVLLITVLVAVLAFATTVTFGLPLI